jgi:hypothetical protein
MASKSKSSSIEAFEKFQKLAQLALSEEDDEPTEEARNAAVKAIAMLEGEDPDLVVLPRSEVEQLKKGIEGSRELASKNKEEKTKNIVMGALLGFGLAKGGVLK